MDVRLVSVDAHALRPGLRKRALSTQRPAELGRRESGRSHVDMRALWAARWSRRRRDTGAMDESEVRALRRDSARLPRRLASVLAPTLPGPRHGGDTTRWSADEELVAVSLLLRRVIFVAW